MPSANTNLPTIEKTWEFRSVIRFDGASSSDETTARRLALFMSYVLCDKERKIYGGTFAAGTTGDTRFTPTEIAGEQQWLGPNNFTAAMVGKQFVIDAGTALSAGNEGSFTIVDVDPSGLWVEYDNGSSVAEADSTVSGHVRRGTFSFPSSCKGSGAGSTGKGAATDGRDRWLSETDLQSSTSAGGNKSWFIWETANGAEIMQIHQTNSASFEFIRSEWWICPEPNGSGFQGGSATAKPTTTPAALSQLHLGSSTTWFGDTTPNSDIHYCSVMMSDDGSEWRLFWVGNGYCHTILWGGVVTDFVDGPLVPFTGSHAWIDITAVSNGETLTYAIFNDAARLQLTIDKDASVGGPFVTAVVQTAEMVVADMIGQHNAFIPDETSQEWHIWPMGLQSLTAGRRGRIGRPYDVWWVNAETHSNFQFGAFMPEDGTRQFVKIGHMLFPWDGSTDWRPN